MSRASLDSATTAANTQESVKACWAADVPEEAAERLQGDVNRLRRSLVDMLEPVGGDNFGTAALSAENESRPGSTSRAVGCLKSDTQHDLDGEITDLLGLKSEAQPAWRAPKVPRFQEDFLSEAVHQKSETTDVTTTMKGVSYISTRMPKEGVKYARGRAAKLMEHPLWQVVFMVLTFYSLFASDLDTMYGTKQSQEVVVWVSTVVLFLFGLEWGLQAYAKQGYLCKGFFWLDLVALVSMLPDTLLVQAMPGSNAFVAARSTKITRILRVASRSSRATRMNRLTRITRVTTLVPRVAQTLGYRRRNDAIKNLVETRIKQIFDCSDDDDDGLLTMDQYHECVSSLKRLPAEGDSEVSGSYMAELGLRQKTANFTTEMSRTGTSSTVFRVGATMTSGTLGTLGSMAPDQEVMTFGEFRQLLLDDEAIRARLVWKCEEQVSHTRNVQSVASKQSEDLGVKVALGVLLILFVQTFISPSAVDSADVLGLQQLQAHATHRLNTTSGSIPAAFHSHVDTWAAGYEGYESTLRKVLYVDVAHSEYCNSLSDFGGQPCPPNALTEAQWAPRRPLADLDGDIRNSEYRFDDILVIRLPTSVEDTSDKIDYETLDRTVTSLAILDVRALEEKKALLSLLTIVLVIVLIFAGIIFLTQDMTYLSRRLFIPLRNLAEGMRDVAKLKLVGLDEDRQHFSEQEEKDLQKLDLAEIETLSRTFQNMKRAIKSWGKYVPWPVVQILLQAGQKAEQGVREQEVTMFFSDIASFTTIVETLDPKDSLLLLSRYFHDMSKIIDKSKGIVIEFIGDAILAVYGAPLENPEHAESGVKATLKMLNELQRLNRWSAGKGLPQVKIRCGVHTGKVTIGNMGFHSRLKYGVVGEHASVPGKLEEMNKEYSTDNLMSESTVNQLPAGAFIVRPIDFVQLKHPGAGGPEIVYQALARKGTAMAGKLKPAAVLHARGMLYYRQGAFKKAAGYFTKVGQLLQEATGAHDEASALMLRRCQAYADTPPKTDWSGVFEDPADEWRTAPRAI